MSDPTTDTLITPPGQKAFFGVYTTATDCMDADLGEYNWPGPISAQRALVKFDDPHNTGCYPGGSLIDIRPYASATQTDTFLLDLNPGTHGFPVKLTWTNLNNNYGSAQLVDPVSGTIVNVDMLLQDSVVITSPISLLYIYTQSPRNLYSIWADSINDRGFTASMRFNPGGSPTEAWFEYGTSDSLGFSTPIVSLGSGDAPLTTRFAFDHLLPNQDYTYRAVVSNGTGTISSVLLSLGTPEGIDTLLPPTLSKNWYSYYDPDTTSINFTGALEANGTTTYAWVEYGTDTTYGDTTPHNIVATGWDWTSVVVSVQGLTTHKVYHGRIVAQNAGGRVSGYDIQFSPRSDTLLPEPYVETLAVDSVTAHSAILNGVINPHGFTATVSFSIGDRYNTVAVATDTVPATTADVPVRIPVTGLGPNLTYVYYIYGSILNGASGIATGTFLSFTTLYDSTYGGIKIPLTMRNHAGQSTTINFGVHNHATDCIDPELGEMGLPPPPPSSAMDFRFVSPSSQYAACYDQGFNNDYRPIDSGAVVDTYKVQMQPGVGGYPITLSWTGVVGHYSGPITLSDGFGGVILNVNMLTIDSAVISLPLTYAFIYAGGPENIVYAKQPSGNDSGTVLTGMYNPQGMTTTAWFEWGTDSTYGNSTASVSLGAASSLQQFNSVLKNLAAGTTYHFRAAVKNNGINYYGLDQTFSPSSVLSVTYPPKLPKEFALHENYPNPFNPSTVISFDLPKGSLIDLTIYNVLGQPVISPIRGKYYSAGTYSVSVNASSLSSGVYFYKLRAGEFQGVRKMVVMK
jgi:hypothetical protein